MHEKQSEVTMATGGETDPHIDTYRLYVRVFIYAVGLFLSLLLIQYLPICEHEHFITFQAVLL